MISSRSRRLFVATQSHRERSSFGFTLIEMLVVLIIMGILGGIVSLSVIKSRDAAVRKACIGAARAVSAAAAQYTSANGSIPDASATKISNSTTWLAKYMSVPSTSTDYDLFFLQVKGAAGSYVSSTTSYAAGDIVGYVVVGVKTGASVSTTSIDANLNSGTIPVTTTTVGPPAVTTTADQKIYGASAGAQGDLCLATNL